MSLTGVAYRDRKMQEFALEVCESNLDAFTDYMQLFLSDMRNSLESDSMWRLSTKQENTLFGNADRVDTDWRRRFYNSFKGAT